MKILFLVPFNNTQYLRETLSSILKQKDYFTKKDIVIINDGLKEKSLTLIRKWSKKYPEIKLVSQKCKGEAAALNRGLLQSPSYDFVAIVEADVKIERKWLSKNLACFNDPRIAGVGGTLKPFSEDNWLARIAGFEVEYKMAGQGRYPLHLTSANVLYRADIFPKLGYFKEELVNSTFDAEFNLRLASSGFRLVYNKGTYAWHHYKQKFSAFLARAYAYGRFRPYLRGQNLYPYDHLIKIQIAIILLAFLLLPLAIYWMAIASYLSPVIVYGVICFLYLFLTLPPVIWTLKHKKKLIMLAYPPVSFLRNSLSLVGLGIGFAQYLFKNNEKSS